MATWQWNGAEFEAKTLTVRDELRITLLSGRLQEATDAQNNEDFYFCNTFARFMATTNLVSGDPGLPMVTAGDSDEEIVAAMDAWLDAAGWLDEWRSAENRANETPNGKALQPGAEKNVSAPSKDNDGANS